MALYVSKTFFGTQYFFFTFLHSLFIFLLFLLYFSLSPIFFLLFLSFYFSHVLFLQFCHFFISLSFQFRFRIHLFNVLSSFISLCFLLYIISLCLYYYPFFLSANVHNFVVLEEQFLNHFLIFLLFFLNFIFH